MSERLKSPNRLSMGKVYQAGWKQINSSAVGPAAARGSACRRCRVDFAPHTASTCRAGYSCRFTGSAHSTHACGAGESSTAAARCIRTSICARGSKCNRCGGREPQGHGNRCTSRRCTGARHDVFAKWTRCGLCAHVTSAICTNDKLSHGRDVPMFFRR